MINSFFYVVISGPDGTTHVSEPILRASEADIQRESQRKLYEDAPDFTVEVVQAVR